MKQYRHPLWPGPGVILFALASILDGCSSTTAVNSTGGNNSCTYARMNEVLRGQEVKIELNDGRDISTRDVTISGDSATWIVMRTNDTSRASVRQIDKIVNKNSLVGGLEGLGFGLVIGGLGGAAATSGVRTPSESGEGGYIFGLVLGGGLGTLVGFTTGAIIGHSYNYEFPMIEMSDSLQKGK